MYRAAIVDDEADVREGLQLLLDWEQQGFYVAGEAANGVRALGNMPLWRPDLVVTDIRMPLLDGLEYVRRIRSQFPDTAVVVISAFGEFQYAREAIQLGVIDFLLKPITRYALIQCLEKVKSQLDERHLLRGRERVRNQFVQEKWLHALCHGKLIKPDELQGVGEIFHLSGQMHYQILLLEMDDYERFETECVEAEIDLKRFMIRNISEEIAMKYGVPQIYEDSQERLGMLLRRDSVNEEELLQMAREIRDEMKKNVKISVSISIGNPYTNWESIAQSYREATQAMSYMLFEGKGGIFHYRQLKKFVHPNELSAGDHYDMIPLLKSMDETELSKVDRELELFFQAMKSRARTPEAVRGMCLELIMAMVRLVREQNGDAKAVYGDKFQEYERAFLKRSMPALQHWLKGLCHRTARYLQELHAAKIPDEMEEVKKWIDEHYAEEITLKMLSAQVYKTPAHLGQLIKSTFGESFHQYVTTLRIEKAKELLRRDNLRVYEIVRKVGYANADAFYERFKQYTGMSPMEYRKNHLGE